MRRQTPPWPGPLTLPAAPRTRPAWEDAYLKALVHVPFHDGTPIVPAVNDGPVPSMISTELTLARRGCARRQPYRQAGLLRHELHQASAVPGRRRVLRPAGHRAAPHATMGRHERDRQLSGPTVAVALHPLVRGTWLRQFANVDLIAIYLTGAATILLLALPFCARLAGYPRDRPAPPCGLAELEQPAEPLGGGRLQIRLLCPRPNSRPGGRGSGSIRPVVIVNNDDGAEGVRYAVLARGGWRRNPALMVLVGLGHGAPTFGCVALRREGYIAQRKSLCCYGPSIRAIKAQRLS